MSPLEFLITAPPSSSRTRSVSGSGGELGGARRAVDGDVARPALEVQGVGLIDLDRAEADLDPARAEPAVAAEVRGSRAAVDVRAGGQLDGDVDRAAVAARQPLAQLRRLDQQLVVRELDPGRVRGAGVPVVGRVARAHVDDGRGAVAGGDPDVAEAEVDRGRDRGRGVEGRHGDALLLFRFEAIWWWLGIGGRSVRPAGEGLAEAPAALPRAAIVVRHAVAAARTSHVLTDIRSRAAACSMPALSCSGRRRLMRAVARSSASGGAGAAGSQSGSAASSAGAGVTTKPGSPPRRRSSTEPGASSRVISSAAADSASSSISRVAASSAAVSRSASSRASSPPARRRRRARREGSPRTASGPCDHYGTCAVPCQHHNGVSVARTVRLAG